MIKIFNFFIKKLNNKMADYEQNFDPLFYGIPHFEDQDYEKEKLMFEDGKHKIVMIFATWCGPCSAFKPRLRELFDMHKDSDDICVGVINGSGQKTTLPSEVKLMDKLKDKVKGFPTIAFFGPDGKFLGTHEGKRTPEEVNKSLKKYMNK